MQEEPIVVMPIGGEPLVLGAEMVRLRWVDGPLGRRDQCDLRADHGRARAGPLNLFLSKNNRSNDHEVDTTL